MPRLRLSLAQVDPTVGDLPGNAAMVRAWTARAAAAGAALVAFPEMVVTGYPVEDLVFRESFIAASRATVERLAEELSEAGLGEIVVVVGYLDADGPARVGADRHPGRGPRNAAAVLHQGRVAARYFKHHLPNYGVFDEDRYFAPGDTLTILRVGGVDVALTICEDLWKAGGPFTVAGTAGVDLVLSINGSPYEAGKSEVRHELIARRAAEAGATVAYVNLVGGQDELVFDGDSTVIRPDGTLVARAPRFVEDLLVLDLDFPEAAPSLANKITAPLSHGWTVEDEAGSGPDRGISPEPSSLTVLAAELTEPTAAETMAPVAEDRGIEEMRIARVTISGVTPRAVGPAPGLRIAEALSADAEIWAALVLGLRDYARKNGFDSVVLGLSGGIDSSLVAAIACDALGPQNVVGVSMPSQFSSDHSREDAADQAKRSGLVYRVAPIQPTVDAFVASLTAAGTEPTGLALENLQARVRGVTLMALSNQEGHLVLTTGNKSELAVGYSTLYGDSIGGFNPIKDVPKTVVWRLARWRNAEAERAGQTPPIPENCVVKPPSAELRPGQLDTDSLPDYLVLDEILGGYVDGDLGRDELIGLGHDRALVDWVLRLVDIAEYKRRQSAPGTKISIKSFGRDRRLPITNRYREVSR